MSVSIIIHPKHGPDPGVSDPFGFAKKMLEDEFHCDVTFIPECGTQVKCHRSVLAAHSTVFKAMFGGDTQEARSGVVQVPGMTKDGVRAMLDYLYCWKTTAPDGNPDICVELLEAGDKYDLPQLCKSMERLLMTKMAQWYSWYTPEASLRLMLFLKDKDPSDLKENALKIFQLKFEEIKELPAYPDLFKEGAEVLMGVVDYLASY